MTGYGLAGEQVTEQGQSNDFFLSSPKAVWLLHFSGPTDSIVGLFAMNSPNKVKPNSHNERNYCLARHKTSVLPSSPAQKKKKIRKKNQHLILLTKRVALSPHVKNTFQKYLVLSLEFLPF